MSGSRQEFIWGGGVYQIPAAGFLPSPSHVSERVSGENGVRKLADCADRRGSAFEGRPAHKSPDCGLTRKSAVSGEIVGEIRKSGFRGPVRNSYGGGLLDSGGASPDVSVVCFREGFRRKRGPEIDQSRRPAGVRV